MRNWAEVNADVEARIAQIEQMTLDQIATFHGWMLSDITTGRIAPREAGRALRKRLKVIEQEQRKGGCGAGPRSRARQVTEERARFPLRSPTA